MLCATARAQDNKLCTTIVIDEIIKSQHKNNDKIKEVWTTLKEKNIVRVRDSDANARPKTVNILSAVESALASSLQNGTIKYSRAVIYTPRPDTPLRADNNNLYMLVEKDFFEDKDRMQTITNRIVSTKQYLTSGGTLYNIHKAIGATDNIPGMYLYENSINVHYGKLLDKPVRKVQKRYIGASYIAECKDGTKIFFAIKGRQAHDTKTKQWSLYYGNPDSTKLNNSFKKVQALYKKAADVSFDFD